MNLPEQLFGFGVTGNYRWRGMDHSVNAHRPIGTCVRVLRNVGQSDFPDIDQMLQDLQGLPSPDDPLYEISF